MLKHRGYEVEYVQAGTDVLSRQDRLDADLVVALGGPVGVDDLDLYPWQGDESVRIRQPLGSQRPLLGLSQLMAAALGARVAQRPNKEITWGQVSFTAAGAGLPLRHLAGLDVLHWHGDAFDLPQGAELMASTPMTPNQAFSVGPAALALQFHPEVPASRMEPWLIGHTVELRAASVDICSLRLSSARQNPDAQALAAGRLLNEWLDDLRKSSVRFGWS